MVHPSVFAGEVVTFNTIPALERIAVVKVATLLWNNCDVTRLINRKRTVIDLKKNWQKIENKVTELGRELMLPELTKIEILKLVKPMCDHVYNWVWFHHSMWNMPKEFCWTQQGTIDRKKTAEVIVKNRHKRVGLRYVIACMYCFESDVTELWDEMLEEYIQPKRVSKSVQSNRNWLELVNFWNDVMTKKIPLRDDKRVERAFKHAVYDGNKTATEFLLNKLTHEKREVSIRNAITWVLDRENPFKEYFLENMLFLLSLVDEAKLSKVLKKKAFIVLYGFLDWPWQGKFMQMANHLWRFLSDCDFKRLLDLLIEKMLNGYEDYNYRGLFTQIWNQSLDSHKRYVIRSCRSGYFLFTLYILGDLRNFHLVVNSATLDEREAIIEFYRKLGRFTGAPYIPELRLEENKIKAVWVEFLAVLKDLEQEEKLSVFDEEHKNVPKKLRTD